MSDTKRDDGPKHGRFYFEDWTAPDPDDEKLHEAMHTARYALSRLTQAEAYRILGAAEAYCHFAGHPAPTKNIVEQLRKLRRRVRSQP
jgi:hypothetical protein